MPFLRLLLLLPLICARRVECFCSFFLFSHLVPPCVLGIKMCPPPFKKRKNHSAWWLNSVTGKCWKRARKSVVKAPGLRFLLPLPFRASQHLQPFIPFAFVGLLQCDGMISMCMAYLGKTALRLPWITSIVGSVRRYGFRFMNMIKRHSIFFLANFRAHPVLLRQACGCV